MRFLLLAAISMVAGLGALWIFRLTSNQAAVAAAKRRVQAYLLELRLFSDEPSLIWRSQKGLLAANARLVGLLLIPAAALTAPMLLLFAQMDAIYGRASLRVGDPVLLTMQMTQPVDTVAPRLETGPEIAVESPPVRVPAERQVSWRIRPLKAVAGIIHVIGPSGVIEKKFSAGRGWSYLSDRRVASVLDWLLWYPAEKPLKPGPVEWLEIRYPPTDVRLGAIELPWLAWFLIISFATAFACKRRMGVTL
jgi:hypothetical protein